LADHHARSQPERTRRRDRRPTKFYKLRDNLKQRGAKVAQIDIARKLTEAIWHMLTTNQPFAPTPALGGAAFRLAA
jgi:hypothetical protein